MKKLFVVAAGMILAAGTSFAQAPSTDKPGAAPKAEKPDKNVPPPEMMSLPKPGPELQTLKSTVGTWDATVEMTSAPGAPTSKGTETVKEVGGLWFVADFKSEMGGAPFEGHGVSGYDTVKKKYVGTWVDSMTTSMMSSEGTYDAAKKTMVDTMSGIGMDGKPAKWKAITEWKDDDTRVFSLFDEGKTVPSMRITYKRRK
jgi:hypothetical protein